MPALYFSNEITDDTSWSNIGTISSDSKINIYIVNQTDTDGTFSLAISPSGIVPFSKDTLYTNILLKSFSTFVASEIYALSGYDVFVFAPISFTVRVEGEILP